MPAMNGWPRAAVLTRIRRGIKVRYMTGYASPQRPSELCGDQSVLQKPFAPRALRRAVRRILDQTES